MLLTRSLRVDASGSWGWGYTRIFLYVERAGCPHSQDLILFFIKTMLTLSRAGLHSTALFIVFVLFQTIQADLGQEAETNSYATGQRQACPDPLMCQSKWGYCGTGADYCGDGCSAGPCWTGTGGQTGTGGNTGDGSIINEQNFACAFNTIDAGTRFSRLSGLRSSGWNPSNRDEAAVFLAHVFHETDGLKTIREYCAPGKRVWYISPLTLFIRFSLQAVAHTMLVRGAAFKVDPIDCTTVVDGFNSLGHATITLLDKH